MLPKINSAMLIVTHACTLACRYCFVQQESSRMSFKTAKRAAEFLIENAGNEVPSINFFGGEPMIMWDSVIKPLTIWLREEYKKPFMLSMTSNCTLMDEEKLAFMKERDIGLLFSLDGAKETQDYNRPFHDGRGSFDILEPMIPKILAVYPNMTLRMTAIPETCAHVFENILWGQEQGYSNFFVTPDVFQPWDNEARERLADEIRKYADYYIECYQTEKRPITFSLFEEALRDIKLINAAEKAGDYRTLPRCRAAGKCGLGAARFASIHPNGNIYGCQEMTSNEGEESIFYIGNLETGVSEQRRLALMAAYDEGAAAGNDCAACAYDRICDGGCVANNYLATGKLNKLPEMYCWWKKTVLRQAVRVMQTLGAEKNRRFKEHWGVRA